MTPPPGAAAAKAWQDLGCPHRAGYAWWRQAQAQLDAGLPATAAAAALRAAAAAADGHAAAAGPDPRAGAAGPHPAPGPRRHRRRARRMMPRCRMG